MPPEIRNAGVTLRWSAHEHEYTERESEWFWALGIAAAALAVIAVLFHDVLFSILIIIAATSIGILATMQHERTEFELSDRGIRVGDRLYQYHEIISFWVEDEHAERPLLLVDTLKIMAPNIIIPIEHVDPALVRAYLVERVPEVRIQEPISHKIFEWLGL